MFRQTQIVLFVFREVSNLPTPQSFQRPETLHRRRRTSTRKRKAGAKQNFSANVKPWSHGKEEKLVSVHESNLAC